MALAVRLPKINWRIIGAGLAAIGILHIVATLLAPRLTPENGFDLFSRELPINRMQVLAPLAPGTQRLPFLSADARYAACRFDSSDGVVRLTAELPGPGWVLALYSPQGDNFFTSVAPPGRRTSVSLILLPQEERVAPDKLPQTIAAQAAQEQDPTLKVTARRGIAVIRAPDQGEAYRVRNQVELGRARCEYRRS